MSNKEYRVGICKKSRAGHGGMKCACCQPKNVKKNYHKAIRRKLKIVDEYNLNLDTGEEYSKQ